METLQQNTFKQLPAPIFTFSSLFSTNTAKVATFNKNAKKKPGSKQQLFEFLSFNKSKMYTFRYNI